MTTTKPRRRWCRLGCVSGNAEMEMREKTKKRRWVTVEVTQEIIDQATPSGCHDCLIALALQRATGVQWHVWFNDARVENYGGPHAIWKMPREVVALRRRFDSRESVEPTSFRLPARFADEEWLAKHGAYLGSYG